MRGTETWRLQAAFPRVSALLGMFWRQQTVGSAAGKMEDGGWALISSPWPRWNLEQDSAAGRLRITSRSRLSPPAHSAVICANTVLHAPMDFGPRERRTRSSPLVRETQLQGNNHQSSVYQYNFSVILASVASIRTNYFQLLCCHFWWNITLRSIQLGRQNSEPGFPPDMSWQCSSCQSKKSKMDASIVVVSTVSP